MTRSIWKVNNILKNKANKEIIWKRNITIMDKDIGNVYKIHTGNGLVHILITEGMVQHKFGEFSLTRKFNAKFVKKVKVKSKTKK